MISEYLIFKKHTMSCMTEFAGLVFGVLLLGKIVSFCLKEMCPIGIFHLKARLPLLPPFPPLINPLSRCLTHKSADVATVTNDDKF